MACSKETSMNNRPLFVIAREIEEDWKKVNFAAAPYLEAMGQLMTVHDMYHYDTARSVVGYFLANAQSWKGEKAKAIKAELKAMVAKTYVR
jgi:hypothetical protein